MEAVINPDDDDLRSPEDGGELPGFFGRLLLWLGRPLIPLANRTARLRHDAQMARLTQRLEAEMKKRRKAEVEKEAAEQEKETLAKMHARIIAMLEKEIAIHNANAKRTTEV